MKTKPLSSSSPSHTYFPSTMVGSRVLWANIISSQRSQWKFSLEDRTTCYWAKSPDDQYVALTLEAPTLFYESSWSVEGKNNNNKGKANKVFDWDTVGDHNGNQIGNLHFSIGLQRQWLGSAQCILGSKAIILSETLLRNNNSYFKWDDNFEYRYV